MMKLVIEFYDLAQETLDRGAEVNDIIRLPSREAIGRFKYLAEKEAETEYGHVRARLAEELRTALERKGEY